VVHVHLVDSKLHQVLDVLSEEIKSLDLHLHTGEVPRQALLLVELEVLAVVVEYLLGRNPYRLEEYVRHL